VQADRVHGPAGQRHGERGDEQGRVRESLTRSDLGGEIPDALVRGGATVFT
jgi:hypothetical protein